MSANLTFELRDQYSTKIWDPKILEPNAKVRSVSGEYFFSVLYSVHREKNSNRKAVAQWAKNTLEKFISDVEKLESELKKLIEQLDQLKLEHPFSVSYPDAKTNQVEFEPRKNSGVCPENAAFLRLFILFDKYVSTLGEVISIAAISQKDYYKNRKQAQSKLRRLMEAYNNAIKKFHAERKKKTAKAEVPA